MAGLSYFTDKEEDFILDYARKVANNPYDNDCNVAKEVITKIEGQYGTKRMSGRG